MTTTLLHSKRSSRRMEIEVLEERSVPGSIMDLGSLGGWGALAYAINNQGHVAGESNTFFGFNPRAYLFWEGDLYDFGSVAETYYYDAAELAMSNSSRLLGLNDNGAYVGQTRTSSGAQHAFLFDWDGGAGGAIDLGTLGGANSSAYAVNNSAWVVGSADTASAFSMHAFLYAAGQMYDLGTLGGLNSEAKAINDVGQIVGSSQTSFGQWRAVLWSDGEMFNLGTLGGFGSRAHDINDAGQVVGESMTGVGFQNHAFLYSDGVMTDLGTLGGNSYAYSINNLGQVVGASDTLSGGRRAFVYSDGVMTDLNTFVTPGSEWIVLREATGINDNGQIVGIGITTSGLMQSFVITL